jgi:hypothetical protein
MMLVDPDGRFLTQRELPRLALIEPCLTDGQLTLAAPGVADFALTVSDDGPRGPVAIWRDTVLAVDQGDAVADWFSAFLATPVRLVRLAEDHVRRVDPAYARRPDDQTSLSDGYPFLLISEASLDDLNGRLEWPLEMRRFRPNIVVAGCPPYAEDTWRQISIGSVCFDVVKPCGRCAITTTDQETAVRGKEPLRTLATYRTVDGKVMFGQNLLYDGAGTIRVGDQVTLLSLAAC